MYRALVGVSLLTVAPLLADATEQEANKPLSGAERYTTQPLRGRVVWLADALARRYGIQLDPDAARSQCALETAAGELHPLVKDARGRGFWLDERIRDIDVELFVRRYQGSPFVQVIRVYALKQDGKYELDYWCDICSIPMYELKACECCQGPTRIRQRRVAPDNTKSEGSQIHESQG